MVCVLIVLVRLVFEWIEGWVKAKLDKWGLGKWVDEGFGERSALLPRDQDDSLDERTSGFRMQGCTC